MYPLLKRVADVVLALALLLLLCPLLIIIIPLQLLTGEGYVFYQQQRVGYRNQLFGILKFATMLKDSARMPGGEITQRGDPRITPMGRILRPTKLNELPQIVNVLKGDMSWVGPRPLMPVSFEQYNPEVQAHIYQVKPGITGIGSIIFRDEEKWVTESDMDPRAFYRIYIFPYKGAVEMWYLQHRSLWVDTCILVLTALAVLFPRWQVVYQLFPDLPPPPEVFRK